MRFRKLIVSTLLLAVPASLVACGDSSSDAGTTTTSATTPGTTQPTDTTAGSSSSAPPVTTRPKPDVQIPSTLPTKLVITDLTEGSGPAAVSGDTVVVFYVGVRSADGTEFDNNFDKGTAFPVTLGSNSVIDGWEQGLLGVKAGGRRQLDIPADLAYGDNPQGDVIQAGDALTFVIDVVAVVPASDPADAPVVSIAGAANREKIDIKDLVVGDGPEIKSGQSAVVHIIAFRADTGEQIQSSWESGTPFTFTFGSGEAIPGLELGIEGMKVGGRRQVAVPYLLAFGDAGSEGVGLPAATDMVMVIDLVAAY